MSSLSILSLPRALSSQISPCTRPIPCDQANLRFASERCNACFDKLMASLSTTLDRPAAQQGWGEIPGGPEPEFRPTAEDTFEASSLANAELLGWELGLEGFAVVGPAHFDADELAAFFRGHAAGFAAYEDDCLSSWVADREREQGAFSDPMDQVHPTEAVEFAGRPVIR